MVTLKSFSLWPFVKKQSIKVKLKINSIVINKSNIVELLGITIDNKLTFNEYISILCCNERYKLYALRRIKKMLKSKPSKMYWLIVCVFTRQLSGCFVGKVNIKKNRHKALKVMKSLMKSLMNYFKWRMKLPFTRNIFMH